VDLGLDQRVALVTGASRGIGRAIAAELTAEGARVAIAARHRETIEATAREIGAVPFVLDNNYPTAAEVLAREVADRLGPIEILVTNTGGPPVAVDGLSLSLDEWEAAYRSLVLTPIALVEAVAPAMRERGWGRIVSVSSSAVREVIDPLILSNAHRAATLAAFKTLSRQLAADGITFNTLLPGRIATDRIAALAGSLEAAEESARSQVPAGRLGRPEELAAVAAFLCSTRAAYITGTALAVDGGMLHGP